jgi:hypothetical protein
MDVKRSAGWEGVCGEKKLVETWSERVRGLDGS